MKNKYLSVSKLSEAKFRQLVRYFCEDFTILQIAKLMHVNRNTANLWINRIRERIYEQVEQEKLKNVSNVQMDETFFCRPSKFYKRYKIPHHEIIVFGMIDDQQKVYAKIVPKVSKQQIYPIISECCQKGTCVSTDGGAVYKGLTLLGYKHFVVNHLDYEFSRYENGTCITTNSIESFWAWMKVRFAKFRGIKWKNMHLHVAESVWRFNHRHDDIYMLLLSLFRVRNL